MLFLAPDGRVWLFYTAQLTQSVNRIEWQKRIDAGQAAHHDYYRQNTAIIRCRVSDDLGHTWGPVQLFHEGPGAFCRHPMRELSNGDWLFPMYYCVYEAGEPEGGAGGSHYSVMRISEDAGRTWREHPVPDSRGRVQATVNEIAPGRLIAFFRSRFADRIYISHSHDYGRAWTLPERTALPNNNASTQCIRLTTGELVMAFNHFSANDEAGKVAWPKERYPLTVALSEDDGQTWPNMRHIDTGDDFAGSANMALNRAVDYPSIIQSRDGQLHVTYSYRGRQCIKHVRVSADWIRGTQEARSGWRL